MNNSLSFLLYQYPTIGQKPFSLISGGRFAALFGPIFGTEAGAGMGLVIVIGGVISIVNGIAGYLI